MEIDLEIRKIEIFEAESFIGNINSDRINCFKQAIEDENNILYGLYDDKNLESCFILKEKEGKTAEITDLTIRYLSIMEVKRDYFEFILNWLKNNNFKEVNILLDNYELIDPDLEEILGFEGFELSSYYHDFVDINRIKEITTIKDDFSVLSFAEFSKTNSDYLNHLTSMISESLSQDQRRSLVSQFRSEEQIYKFIESVINGTHGKLLIQESVVAVKDNKPVGIAFVTHESEEEAVSPLIVISISHQKTLVLESLVATASINLIKTGYKQLYLALIALKSVNRDKIMLLGFKVVDKSIIYHKNF